jgi:hypothetical protein
MSSGFLAAKKLMPNLGVGLGLRRELAAETFENAEQIDFLELVPRKLHGARWKNSRASRHRP